MIWRHFLAAGLAGKQKGESRLKSRITTPKPPLMRLNVFAQRKSFSTLRCNISLTSEKKAGLAAGLISTAQPKPTWGEHPIVR
jgi:hypothetical protein